MSEEKQFVYVIEMSSPGYEMGYYTKLVLGVHMSVGWESTYVIYKTLEAAKRWVENGYPDESLGWHEITIGNGNYRAWVIERRYSHLDRWGATRIIEVEVQP